MWAHHAESQLLEAEHIEAPDQYQFQQLKLGCAKQEPNNQLEETQVTLLFYHSCHAWIVRADKSQDDLQTLFPEYPRDQPFHSALQPLKSSKIPSTDMVLYADLPHSTEINIPPELLMATIVNIQIYVHTHPQQDILILMIDIKQAREQCKDSLWKFVPHTWMSKHGRLAKLNIQQGAIQVMFVPNYFCYHLPYQMSWR